MNKSRIENDAKEIFNKQHISYSRYFTTPAPFQNLLWFVVVGNDSGYYIGFRSLLDSKKEIDFHFILRNDSLLNGVKDHEQLQQLIRFSQQFYTVDKKQDTLVFNDLRFGQIIGWQDPDAGFVFHYYLEHPKNNSLVVQRGRFKGWNMQTVIFLLKRVSGN